MGDGCTWKNAIEQLRQIGKEDHAFAQARLIRNRNQARNTVAGLYVRYMITSNNLTSCHDTIIQPQLRNLIKKMLMYIYGRILELKQILIDEDCSIYTPIIDELITQRVTHDQFELKIPRCFQNDRRPFLNEMDSVVENIIRRKKAESTNLFEIQEEEEEGEGGEEERQYEEKKEKYEVEEEMINDDQLVSQESSESNIDIIGLKQNENSMPERFKEITDADILRSLAIQLIQKHIRAMRDRIIINELLAAKRYRENIISGKYIEPSKNKAQEAAITIQRYWRNYQLILYTRMRIQKQNIEIGLHMPSRRPTFDTELEQVANEIRAKQTEAAMELKKAIDKCQNKLKSHARYDITEDIEDELRAYVWTYYKTCKMIPSWPDSTPIMFVDNNILGLPPIILPDNILRGLDIPRVNYESALKQRVPLGGSAIFHTGRWITMEMVQKLATFIIEFENKTTGEKNKLMKEFDKKNKIEKRANIELEKHKAKEREKNRAFGVVPEPSGLTELFKDTLDEFDTNWKMHDESENWPRTDLIKSEIFENAHIELRASVDTNIREELIKLKIADAKDSGKTYKASKEKSKTKKKKRHQKKKKLPNQKDIFEELVKHGMIEKSCISKFNEFKGEVSYSGSILREDPYNLNPPYGLGDVRQIIKELCVIGLLFPELRKLKQIKFNSSILIAGPEKSGKSMLINAVCAETGSLKIKLTLENVSKNYSSDKHIKRLVDIIVKLATTYQPVVIEVNLADVPFYKKTPNELKLFKPKLMQKLLLKLMKSIKLTERIIVIGKATSPWLTASKQLEKVFKTVVFTVPDYNTTFMFINDLLMSYPAISRTFPVTLLTTMLASYPRHVIAEIITKVLTQERLLMLRNKPLKPVEFVSVIVTYPKMAPSELCDQYHDWYSNNTFLGRKKKTSMERKNEVKVKDSHK